MPMRIKTRRPDPPRQSQLATLRAASQRESARTEIERKLAKLGELAALAKSMVQSAPPPPSSIPRPPPPPQRGLQYDERVGWHIPCSLTAEQLALGMPSEQTLRFMRAARDKYEAEAKQRAQQRPDLPPNFKVDFMGRVAPR
jgi:hypothetical protein